MRLATLSNQRPALVVGEEILDLHAAAAFLSDPHYAVESVRAMITGWAGLQPVLAALAERIRLNESLADGLRTSGALSGFYDTPLAAPIPAPGTILAAGMNYTDHLDEMKTPRPDFPYAFVKASSSVIGTGTEILGPQGHNEHVDWEAELAVVIGKPCYRTTEAEALEHVFGYTAANDISARDWVAMALGSAGGMPTVQEWGRNIMGKQYPTFCPLGPILVTADEIPDPQGLAIGTRVNSEIMQASNTALMVFSVAELIAYYSQFWRLMPGDIVLTGTMGGVGFGRKPQRFLRAGDLVEVTIDRIGTLSNRFSTG